MRVLVFATSDPELDENAAPFVVIPDGPEAFLPPHPDGLEWSYYVTTTTGDVFLMHRRDEAEAGLAANGFFVFGKPPDRDRLDAVLAEEGGP
jgi:hypothetical protein